MRWSISIVFLALLVSACGHHPEAVRGFVGEIVQVRANEGEQYSPTNGPVTLTCLVVRVHQPGKSRDSATVRIVLHGPYAPDVDGAVGDTVSFRVRGPLPFSGELSRRDLQGFRVHRKNVSAASSTNSPAAAAHRT